MLRKEKSINNTIYRLGKVKVLRIKNKVKNYKFYFLGIPFLIINKSLIFKIKNILHTESFVKEFFAHNYNKNSNEFVAITNESYEKKPDDVKLIAFYLPQYHSFPVNDKSFGRGFTEWTNVTRAVPHFVGHNQPQLPIDVGFYDLAHDDVMYRQIELAKMYGLHGFCFYYYWFSGENPMKKPIQNWLENKELNFPFCFCWANENWSKLWDGENHELILEQKLSDGDDEKFFNDILPYFKDERYIKVDNKPFFIVYRPQLFEQERFKKFMGIMDKLAKENGFDGVYFCCNNARAFNSQKEWGFDALVEFPPHDLKNVIPKTVKGFLNKNYTCHFGDMEDYILNKKYFYETENKTIKTLFTSWDNTARKAYSGGFIYDGETPELYKMWLSDLIKWTKENHEKEEQFVFINAWNEWAEGAHLEPDNKYGYAYLQATKEAMEGK